MIATLAVLSKIPAAVYLVILIPLMVSSQYVLKNKILLAIVSFIPVFALWYWYFVWNIYLTELTGTWYNLGKTFSEGSKQILENLPIVLKRFYFSAFLGYGFFVLSLWGLFCSIRNHNKIVLVSVGLVTLVFGCYVLKSGFFFYHHNYYIVPFVPVLALLAGVGLTTISHKKLRIAILTICIIESLLNQHDDFFIKDRERHLLQLTEIAEQVSLPQDLIATNGNANPQMMFFAHRKGWTCSAEKLGNERYVRLLTEKGCKYLFVDKHLQSTDLPYKIVFENEDFVVYAIDN